MNPSVWIDRLGGLASSACAIHCFVMALVPAALSFVGLEVLANEAFEWGFFTAAICFAAVAAVVGYRAHNTWWVLAGFGAGALVLSAGRFGEAFALHEAGALLSISGGVLLLLTHLASISRTRACCDPCTP